MTAGQLRYIRRPRRSTPLRGRDKCKTYKQKEGSTAFGVALFIYANAFKMCAITSTVQPLPIPKTAFLIGKTEV